MTETTRHETHEILETMPNPEPSETAAEAAAEQVAAIPEAAAAAAAEQPSAHDAHVAAERVEARMEAEALTSIQSSLSNLERMHQETQATLTEHLTSHNPPPPSSLPPEIPAAGEAAGELQTVVQAPPADEAISAKGNQSERPRRGLLHNRRR